MDNWFTKVDDIDNGLAADFNGSLSGLGVESVSDTYNMSEALLALPAVFKDEDESIMKMALMHSSGVSMAPFLSLADVSLLDSDANIYISPSPVDSLRSNSLTPIIINEKAASDHNNAEWLKLIKSMKLTEISDDASSLVIDLISENFPSSITHKFQYVLKAPTSPSAKLSDETLTYLNQGQLYELNFKRLTDSSDLLQYSLKSLITLKLDDKKFKMEEQLSLWQKMHPRERLIDFDSNLSKGFLEIKISDKDVNCLEVIWDSKRMKQATLWLKINCISTEFTVKKLGGEKGIPFRLQVETFLKCNEQARNRKLHKASCLVKIFKMRGADRKNKTDREKLEKSSQKKKYQPYFECTVLTEMPIDNSEMIESFPDPIQRINQIPSSENYSINQQTLSNITSTDSNYTPIYQSEKNILLQTGIASGSQSSSRKRHSESCLCISSPAKNCTSPQEDVLISMSSPDEVITWLDRNRFRKYTETFQNFSGADILRLTKDDLIQICGLADGIRLYNSLQARFVQPRLTIFVCQRKSEKMVAHSPVTSSLSSSPSPSPTPISDSLPPKHLFISPTALHHDDRKDGQNVDNQNSTAMNDNFILNTSNRSASKNMHFNDHFYHLATANGSCSNDTIHFNESHDGVVQSLNPPIISECKVFKATDEGGTSVCSSSTTFNGSVIEEVPRIEECDINGRINNFPDIMDHGKKIIVLSENVSAKSHVNLFAESDETRNRVDGEIINSNNLNVVIRPILNYKPIPDLLSDDSGFVELKLTEKDNVLNLGAKSCNLIDRKMVEINSSNEKTDASFDRPPFIVSIDQSVSRDVDALAAGYKDPPKEQTMGFCSRRFPLRKLSCGSSCKRPIRDARTDENINESTVATSKKQKIHHLQFSPTFLDVYHAVYMDHLSERQLAHKLSDLLKIDESQIVEILLHSMLGIHVLVTDLVVQNIPNQSHYEMEVNEVDEQSGNYRIILKSVLQA